MRGRGWMGVGGGGEDRSVDGKEVRG